MGGIVQSGIYAFVYLLLDGSYCQRIVSGIWLGDSQWEQEQIEVRGKQHHLGLNGNQPYVKVA